MTLAVRTPNWIGDCIMFRPALGLLESRFAPSELILVTRPHLAELFTPPLVPPAAAHPVIALPPARGWRRFRAAALLKTRSLKRGLLFTNSLSSALTFRMAGIRRLTGYRRDGRGFLLQRGLAWPETTTHQVDAYLALAAAELEQPVPPSPAAPVLEVPSAFRAEAARRLTALGAGPEYGWIGISPCTAYGPAKEWPHERVAELIVSLAESRRDVTVLLFGGPQDHRRLEALGAVAPGRVVNLALPLTLAESVAAAALCRAFVSNDSGMLHVAAAVGAPLVALFGPTDPARVLPRGSGIRVIRHPVPCSPCRQRHCDHLSCMEAITAAQVHAAVESLLLPGRGGPGI